ncbi:MAG: hypothetical protein GVY19_04640 [Bacteroidetes bacterium]|jgi:glycosyltransferase involved in cell wall biosynthesis|nr:hypothetical protein [Bacteroidota bacterium]
MELIIIHHHLNPGGVTRVIESQIIALKNKLPHLTINVLVGNIPDGYQLPVKNVKINEIPELNYLDKNQTKPNQLVYLYESLMAKLKPYIGKNTIIHAHNPNLGKNPVLTYTLYRLCAEGINIFNHAHDFAEDRPDNWQFLEKIFSELTSLHIDNIMYPEMDNYKLGVLNSFDFRRLQQKGIAINRLFWIPNPVSLEINTNQIQKVNIREKITRELEIDPAKPIITYPVRVIQRKNIGEYILLSALFGDKANWLVTQPPKNPQEVIQYKEWKTFCRQHQIPVKFEVGLQVNFEELIIASDICFTTSIREGFGMVYLEPWLFNTPVMGRNIPYITEDLKNKAIEFPVLYDYIQVENKDFSDMDNNKQQDIIHDVIHNSTLKDDIITHNKHLISIFETVDPTIVERNKTIIQSEFSLNKYAGLLYEIYEGFVG